MRHDRDPCDGLSRVLSLRLQQSTDNAAYHDGGACMAHLAACKRSKNHSALEPECTCNLLGISLAAHYITYIVGISRVPLYKTKTASSSFVGKSMVPQSSATSFSHRLISSACGRLVLADDPPASDRQLFGVRDTCQDRQGERLTRRG